MDGQTYKIWCCITPDIFKFYKQYLCLEAVFNLPIAAILLLGIFLNFTKGTNKEFSLLVALPALGVPIFFMNLPIMLKSTQNLRKGWHNYTKGAATVTLVYRLFLALYQTGAFLSYTIAFPFLSFALPSIVFISDHSTMYPEEAQATYRKLVGYLLLAGFVIWIFVAAWYYVCVCFFVHSIRLCKALRGLKKDGEVQVGSFDNYVLAAEY